MVVVSDPFPRAGDPDATGLPRRGQEGTPPEPFARPRGREDRRIPVREMYRFSLIILSALVSGWVHAAEPPPERVVLLHGLARTWRSMEPLAEHLRAAGFTVHNIDYPSRDQSADELVALIADELVECCSQGGGPLHFVTHSLGGILVRAYLSRYRPPNLGRVVLLAPPNQGSELVDALGENLVFQSILGPTATDLGTDAASFPNRIPTPDYELGIIAGRRSVNPIGSAIIPGPDDGAVSIESAKLQGATDFIVVDATHTFIMSSAAVAEQVVRFLRTGAFDHPMP